MKALDALSEFNGFVAEHGKAIEHLTPEDAITLMIDFYRDVRAEDCSLEEDGDMLLSRGWNDTPNSMRGQTKWASHRAGSRPSYMNKGRYTRVGANHGSEQPQPRINSRPGTENTLKRVPERRAAPEPVSTGFRYQTSNSFDGRRPALSYPIRPGR